MSKREITSDWFRFLRDEICQKCENIEQEFAHSSAGISPGKFERKKWNRDGGGGGEMSIMKGNVFEKIGVNISTVHGEFSEIMRKEIPGADKDPKFFATGVSLVAHMKSPLVPAMHFNTRYIETTKSWFGGGGDMTPTFEEDEETELFHKFFKDACDKHDPEYYPKYKKYCDEYFFLKHRNEPRGVGGIFYDYLDSGNFKNDFEFTKDVGSAMSNIIPEIVNRKMNLKYSDEQKEAQLIKRGRYVEFNLLYDRGTKFGLMTGGNVEAILMSLPPEVKW
jgi:coproporphyrinogen III oxidase